MTDENANPADLTMDEKLDGILTDLADVKTRLSAPERADGGQSAADEARERRKLAGLKAFQAAWDSRRRREEIMLSRFVRNKVGAVTNEQFERLKAAWFDGGKQAFEDEISRIEAEKIGSAK
jgi:hypothetical protein